MEGSEGKHVLTMHLFWSSLLCVQIHMMLNPPLRPPHPCGRSHTLGLEEIGHSLLAWMLAG
jgi:hypothetical protein